MEYNNNTKIADVEAELPKNENEFGYESLQSVRNKLLDLTGRNQLLNYKHPKASCVRIIDELPDQIYAELQSSKTFSFIPVPDPTQEELIAEGYLTENEEGELEETKLFPTAEQWAKCLGFDTRYELPIAEDATDEDEKHQDLNIQTLMYATELEARLRNIRGKAETAIEESGSNILYLVLGFLEWYESRDSDVKRLAPLFTLPVRLERAQLDREQGVFRYVITLKDEGLLTNITLKEKLANDFDLILPDITDESSPEAYFSEIKENLLRHQPHWQVLRQATLAILNFSKQVMFEDLDPAKWPADNRIEDHPIINQFFASQAEPEETVGSGFAEEYLIDNIEQVHEQFPLVYDADSSQHSALIDAVKGSSLVIEGPPGSGKSQTITNLIAACIANGKRVLFVAEKMAALDVVKNRLDRAGLGDFCLELHSHKTQKLRLLEDLKQRLDKQGRYLHPHEIDADIARYEDLKSKLNHYVELINAQWKKTGLTSHEIFHSATRLREELKLNPADFFIEGIDGDSLTIVRRKELSDFAEMLENIFNQVQEQAKGGDIRNHHWFGVNNANLMGHEQAELVTKLQQWNEALSGVQQTINEEVLTHYSVEGSLLNQWDDISRFVSTVINLPELIGGEPLQLLEELTPLADELDALLNEYEKGYEEIDRLSKVFKAESLIDSHSVEDISSAMDELTSYGLIETEKLTTPHQDFNRLKDSFQTVSSLYEQISALREKLPADMVEFCSGLPNDIKQFSLFLDLLGKLPEDLWRHRSSVYDAPELDDLLEQMTGKFDHLVPLHQELGEHFNLAQLPSAKTLADLRDIICHAGIFAFFTKRWWVARKVFFSLATSLQPNKKQLKGLLPSLVDYKKGLEEIDQLNFRNQALGDVYQGMDTPLDRIRTLRNWYRDVRAEYGRGLSPNVKFAEQLFTMDRDLALSLADLAKQGLSKNLKAITGLLAEMRGRYPKHTQINDNTISLIGQETSLQRLALDLQKPLKTAFKHLKGDGISVAQVHQYAAALNTHQAMVLNWQEQPAIAILSPEPLLLEIKPGKRNDQALAIAKNLLKIVQACVASPALCEVLRSRSEVTVYQSLLEKGKRIQALCETSLERGELFEALGKVNTNEWQATTDQALNALIERNERALNNPKWLNTWLDYLRIRLKLADQGMKSVLDKLENGVIGSDLLSEVVELAMKTQLVNEVFNEEPLLADFAGMEQMALRERFCEYDRKLLALNREKIAFRASQQEPPAGNASGKVGTYTDTALIKHEAGKKTRHIAVRALIERAGKAIQTLKPCFMMSPMSVAQYIAPGQFEFDIVVMDEASQIRPEDALGAIARGKSLVVVGDPKQLPPTSFFDKVANDDFDEDTVALEESESILESAIPMFKTRRLRWHYRSRHEALIAFSNFHYYNSDLVIFPSPYSGGAEFGIRFHPVKRGRFTRGKNVEEARIIAKAALEHMLLRPDESIGLVAMNAEQRTEIEMHVEQLVKEDPKFKSAMEVNYGSEEPLFIKNLENVQGDERDVIMISMTYGPDEIGGRVFQRFGPINKDVGWRRLNVLFTRSKKRMHIFSSMISADILVNSSSKKGVQSLRAFLEYCENGHLHGAVETSKQPDSDFEIAVIEQLKQHGYECEPQLGVAGYYLDMAVRDPDSRGRFLMGIECDGATYHSGKSARDRDRLRQQILESLGWRIRRIWSTDWFKNPEAQLQPILNELESLRSSPDEQEHEKGLMEAEALEQASVAAAAEAEENVEEFEDSLSAQCLEGEGSSLRSVLADFDQKYVQVKYPNTPATSRLLRPAMLEALINELPTSKEEFALVIPGYLRKGTDVNEAREFLDSVLEIIADYG